MPGRHMSQSGSLQTSSFCIGPAHPVEHTGVWLCVGACVCWVWEMQKPYLWWLWLALLYSHMLCFDVGLSHAQQPRSQSVVSEVEATQGSLNLNASEFELNENFFNFFLFWNIVDLYPCVTFKCAAKLFSYTYSYPRWLRWRRIGVQWKRPGFDPWVRKIPWRREWLPIPVFLPGESHGPRSLVIYSPWGHKESDTTEPLTLHLFLIPILLQILFPFR